MGQVGSLPDGSELKAPEERVGHDEAVRANIGLVFVKPHAVNDKVVTLVRGHLEVG